MSCSEKGVNFLIYGICDLLIEVNENGSITGGKLYYTGGVFADYTHGGSSGKADEIITHCQSFIRENEPNVAMWIYDYDFSRYGYGLTRKGSGTDIFDINQYLELLFLY